MKRLLCIFVMGSEVRQFVHSGLFTELMELGWKITVMSKIVDQDIRDQLPVEVELILIPNYPHSFAAETCTKIIDRAFNLHRRKQGDQNWNYGKTIIKNWRERLLQNFINATGWVISKLPGYLTKLVPLEMKLYKQSDRTIWRHYLSQNQINAILVNVPRQVLWNPIFSTAQELGIKTFLLYHTSKDINANPRINHSFTNIGVWNTRMKKDIEISNPWIDPEIIKVVGCGHFDCVGRKDRLPLESDFREQIGALSDSHLLLYPTAGPGIVPEEERYIDLVVEAVKKAEKIITRKIQIVFRINPMDNRETLINYLNKNYPDHITLRPDWRDLRKSNWTYARKSDPFIYNALLQYSSLCVTIPSTVTIDCALSGLPVINLGIEVSGKQPLIGSLRGFWEIDFNRSVRETQAAKFVISKNELEDSILKYLNNKSQDSMQREALINQEIDGIYPGQSSKLSAHLINN